MKLIIDTEIIKDLIENEWGYEGIRDDLQRKAKLHTYNSNFKEISIEYSRSN